MDWDRVGQSEEVGMIVVSAEKMRQVVRGRIEWTEERLRQVRADGKPVIGHDKQVQVQVAARLSAEWGTAAASSDTAAITCRIRQAAYMGGPGDCPEQQEDG
jgi:hypothetical protein